MIPEAPLRKTEVGLVPEHVFVGAGDGPCAILAIGARMGRDIVYPRAEAADVDTPYRDAWLGSDA